MNRGGGSKNGDGENTWMGIPCPNASTYTVAIMGVSRLSLPFSGSSSLRWEGRGENYDDSDNNYDGVQKPQQFVLYWALFFSPAGIRKVIGYKKLK